MKTKIITLLIVSLVGISSLFAHSKTITSEYVDRLLAPYFEMQRSLAGDDFAGSQTNAKTLVGVLGHGPSHEDAPSLADLSDEVKKILDASDIKMVRAAFLDVSNQLARMVKHVGTSGEADVYKMRCPMAFNGKGGEWLQNSDKLLNPYYGSAMLTCGTVLEQVAEVSGDFE